MSILNDFKLPYCSGIFGENQEIEETLDEIKTEIQETGK